MTKRELIESLKSINPLCGDEEEWRVEAGNLLLEFLSDEDIKEAYLGVPRN